MMSWFNFLFIFPDYNIHSTPLLVLVLQGLIFSALLGIRFFKEKRTSDVLLALILLITCYHRTRYTIGFMDWYDTYRNTKINYYLISLEMILAPLLYFYVKSITTSDFKFKKKDVLHFLPWVLFFAVKIFIFLSDVTEPDFSEYQNGPAVVNFEWKYVTPLVILFSICQMLLYLAFTFQHFFSYKVKVQQNFSNTYKFELNWIRNFLLVYSFLFMYGVFQIFIDEFVTSLHWTQKWWLQFFSALIVIYVGIKGYFTNTVALTVLNFESKTQNQSSKKNTKNEELEVYKNKVIAYFEKEKPYLNPDLNLTDLAKALQMNRATLSEVINYGFHQNFNDFVNTFRVALIKEKLQKGEHAKISLLGIAFDAGFNSKATFNRVFKKLTHTSPTEFLSTLKE